MMNMYEYKLDYLNWISWNNRNIRINEHDTTIFPFVSTNGENIEESEKTTKCNRFVIIIYLDKFQFFKNFQYNVYVKITLCNLPCVFGRRKVFKVCFISTTCRLVTNESRINTSFNGIWNSTYRRQLREWILFLATIRYNTLRCDATNVSAVTDTERAQYALSPPGNLYTRVRFPSWTRR